MMKKFVVNNMGWLTKGKKQWMTEFYQMLFGQMLFGNMLLGEMSFD